MVSKNNSHLYDEKMNRKDFRYSIKKLNVGVASVLVGVTFGLGALVGSASADEVAAQPTSTQVAASADDNQTAQPATQTTTLNVADAQSTPVSDDMLRASAVADTDRAAQTNEHQSYTTPDRSQTQPVNTDDTAKYGALVDDGYKIGWTQQRLSNRPNDPGFILSDDGKTLVYRLAAGDQTAASSNDVLSLIYAKQDDTHVIWGDDKRLAENGQTDPANGVQWSYYKKSNYLANGNRSFVLDLLDTRRIGDFKVDLNPANYAGKETTSELVIPADNASKKTYYPGVTISDSSEANVNYYSGSKLASGYLVALNTLATKINKYHKMFGEQKQLKLFLHQLMLHQ